jgi:hypothetical protein
MGTGRTARVHRGFHRTGIVLAALVAIAGFLVVFGLAADNSSLGEVRGIATLWIIGLAACTYALIRALGWIIAGFVGE